MTKVQHILVPTDGSEGALKAATLAGDLARNLDAKVTVLLVQDERSVLAEAWNTAIGEYAGGSSVGAVEAARAAMEENARNNALANTGSAVGDVASGIELTQIWGHPADDICRYAAEHGVDLIVMGSQGLSALGRAFLGSVSHAVVNSADCAVTIVK